MSIEFMYPKFLLQSTKMNGSAMEAALLRKLAL